MSKKAQSAMQLVQIKIDPETLAMLDEACGDLEAATKASGDNFGGRSHTIRKMIRYVHRMRPWARSA